MEKFNFWQKWITGTGILIIIFGILIILNIGTESYGKLFWENEIIPESALSFRNWFFGVYSALVFVFGIFIIFISPKSFKKQEKWAWSCLLTTYTAWFVIESSSSLYHGIYANIPGNLLLYIILTIPLVFTKKYMK